MMHYLLFIIYLYRILKLSVLPLIAHVPLDLVYGDTQEDLGLKFFFG
jgi:hypothetical protein